MTREPETVIDVTDMPDDEQLEVVTRLIESMNEEHELRHETIPDEGETTTVEWHGDSMADAMGRAYKTRDIVQERTGKSVEVEPTGKAWKLPSATLYQFELTVV